MNLVYLASPGTTFPSRSASSIHIMRMCEAFSQLGHDVTLIASHKSNATPHEIFDFYGVAKSFHIKLIKLGKFKGKTLVFSLQQSLQGKKLRPDIIVSRSAQSAGISARLGLPVIYDSHGPIWLSSRIDDFFYELMRNNKHLRKMTVNSMALKRIYQINNKLPHCDISVAHNGSTENGLVDYPAHWPGRPGCLQVGYMGHLYPGRGIEIIIECASRLPQFDFHIVGGMPDDIEHWKTQVDLTNVYFHGFIPPADVYKYRNKCDILLAPYKKNGVAVSGGRGDSSTYMNPIKIIEYMSSKKAIICSDLDILREILDDTCCMFSSPNNVDAWVASLIQLQDKSLRDRLSDNVYARFKENLTWKARARIMLSGFTSEHPESLL